MSLDDLQAQLRGALDQQFAALKQHYETEIAEARQQAAAEAEGEAAARIARVRAEMEAHVQQLVAGTRAEAEQRTREAAAVERHALEQQLRQDFDQQVVEAVTAARADAERETREAATLEREALEQQLRQEFGQQVEQAAASARRTAELERESERRRAQNELDAERARAKAELEGQRQRAEAELDAERERAGAEVEAERQRAAAAPPVLAVGPAAVARVAAAIRDLDDTRTLSQALDTLLAHAGSLSGRAALFLIDGDRLKAWKSEGMPEHDVRIVESPIGGRDLLARAIQSGGALPISADLPAPPFARLPADRPGVAAPLMIGGRAVAVLYADQGADTPPQAGVFEIVELLARHASSLVALRTAMRTLDVLRGVSPEAADGDHAGDDQAARRFARLLVSEIKLYNEPAVRAGREQRDLLRRLGAEIERARRLYEERVPPAVGARHAYFQQELVQTLADGDPALLGTT